MMLVSTCDYRCASADLPGHSALRDSDDDDSGVWRHVLDHLL